MKQSYYGRYFERKLTVKLDQRQHLFLYVTLNASTKSLPDWFINVVTEKTEILEYIGYSGLVDILVEYDLGRLHVLKCLAVIECQVDEVLMNSTTRRIQNEPVFESLIDLYVERVYGLEDLCIGELPPGSLCNLQLLNVRTCSHLVDALLQSNLLLRLQNLEILHCEQVEDARGTKMEHVFRFEELEGQQTVLTKLREITLCNLVSLERIWIGYPPNGAFCNLNSLAIRGCNKLKYLLAFGATISFSQLELLWVDDCSDLKSLFSPTLGQESKVVIPKLKEMYSSSLPQLSGFFSCLYQEATTQLHCPSLEHLYVYGCPKLSNLAASDFPQQERSPCQ